MSNGERGVVYVATGDAYRTAAVASARSLRATNPDLAVTLFTDDDRPRDPFDRVEPVENPHLRSKVDSMWMSPYRDTLYLDSDTRVVGDLSPAFRLLERFDLAAAQVPRWYLRTYLRQHVHDVPPSFPQYDSGVVFFRRTPEVIAFFQEWQAAYHATNFGMDQVTFRDCLWASDLRIATLQAIYNTRRYTWADRLFSARPAPAILHTTHYHPKKAGSPLRRWLREAAMPPLAGR
jgi:hypothetical protein